MFSFSKSVISNQEKDGELKKLKESENWYRTLVEAAHDMIYVINKNFQLEFVNSFAAKYLKKDAAELIGKQHAEFFPPKIAERHEENLKKVLKTGQSLYSEADEIMCGKRIFLGSWLCPIFDEKGKVNAVLGISRDITSRKILELQLSQSEESYRNIVELSLDAMIVHREGKIIYINKAALIMMNTDDPQKIIGQPLMNFVHPDSRDLVKQRIEDLASGKKENVPFVEEKFIRLDGSPVDVEVGSVAIIFRGTKAFQVIARDLTQKKNTEQEKLKYLSEIEKINKYLVGRELKMKELKKEIVELKQKCA